MAREMKDSRIEWIGEIPADWDVVKVKNVFSKHKDIVGDNVEKYERLALTLNGVIKRSKEDREGLQPTDFMDYQILRKGDLVFKLIDLENTQTSRVGYSPYEGLVSPAYICLSCKNKEIDPKFAEKYFMSLWNRHIFNSMGDCGVRSSLNASDLLNIPIVLPDIGLQHRIASFLDSKCAEIDKAVEATKASIEEYRKLRQAIITEAVTKGLDPNVEMKDSGVEWIGEIPANWDVAIFSKLGKQIKDSNKGLIENNLLSLSYGRIVEKNIDTTFGLLPESFETYNIIEKNDIVLRLTDLQNDHKSLRVGLSSERGIITSAYISVRLNDTILPKYMYYQLHSFDVCKGFYGMGAGVRQGLNWEEVKRLQIIVPSEEEQQEIVNFLEKRCSEIDSLIKSKEKIIEELTAYRKSLIYEYVTGKKEVPIESA